MSSSLTILEDFLCPKCVFYNQGICKNKHCEAIKALSRILTKEGVEAFAEILVKEE